MNSHQQARVAAWVLGMGLVVAGVMWLAYYVQLGHCRFHHNNELCAAECSGIVLNRGSSGPMCGFHYRVVMDAVEWELGR